MRRRPPRDVLVHFHIFKNAGTSIDACLEESFGPAWGKYDPAPDWTNVTTRQLLAFVDEHPQVRAISSHQLRWPEPHTRHVRAHPIVFVRHPIDRVASIYAFRRRGDHVDAAGRTFPDFIRWLLGPEGNIVGRSFQTMFLSDDNELVARGPHGTEATAEHLRQAVRRLEALPAFGLVERFDDSIAWLQSTLGPVFPELALRPRQENASRGDEPLERRLADIAEALGPELNGALWQRNELDLTLYERATMLFDERRPTRLTVAPGLTPSGRPGA